MGRIVEYLSDPGWWFTAVFIAVIVSVISAFLKDALLAALAKISKYYGVRKKKIDEQMDKELNLILSDTNLLILKFSQLILRTLGTISLVISYIFLASLYIIFEGEIRTGAYIYLKIAVIISGAGATYTAFKCIPEVKVVKRAYMKYRRQIIFAKQKKGDLGEIENSIESKPYGVEIKASE